MLPFFVLFVLWLINKVLMMKPQTKMICWQDGEFWLGYLEEYPDYMTQGLTREELKDNLRDIYFELNSGRIPCVRKEEELVLA